MALFGSFCSPEMTVLSPTSASFIVTTKPGGHRNACVASNKFCFGVDRKEKIESVNSRKASSKRLHPVHKSVQSGSSPRKVGTTDFKRVIAIDAEMVGVRGNRSALARISMVNYKGQVILDTFVRCEEPIVDYRTHVSGILPEDLVSDQAMDFHACRRIVSQTIRGKILVGHALENDLECLRISHPPEQIRDTSQYIKFMKYNPYYGCYQRRRLRDLSKQFLGMTIQEGEHDSVIDARATLRLYKMVAEDWEDWFLERQFANLSLSPKVHQFQQSPLWSPKNK